MAFIALLRRLATCFKGPVRAIKRHLAVRLEIVPPLVSHRRSRAIVGFGHSGLLQKHGGETWLDSVEEDQLPHVRSQKSPDFQVIKH